MKTDTLEHWTGPDLIEAIVLEAIGDTKFPRRSRWNPGKQRLPWLHVTLEPGRIGVEVTRPTVRNLRSRETPNDIYFVLRLDEGDDRSREIDRLCGYVWDQARSFRPKRTAEQDAEINKLLGRWGNR